jgi:uncharacterized YigZ family protein
LRLEACGLQLLPTTILVEPCTATHEVKRSVFVAVAEPLSEPGQVEALLEKLRDPDARHNCWAWRCDGEYRFNDDGEPAGTAGRPMLQAIEGAGLERTLVVVRRYFGGIKLGAGGLVRAYSAATAACLDEAQTRHLTPHITLEIQVPFAHSQTLFQLLGNRQVSAPNHSPDGVSVTVLIAETESETLLSELRNQTRGQIQVKRGDVELA